VASAGLCLPALIRPGSPPGRPTGVTSRPSSAWWQAGALSAIGFQWPAPACCDQFGVGQMAHGKVIHTSSVREADRKSIKRDLVLPVTLLCAATILHRDGWVLKLSRKARRIGL
jgi:hypothetical protein